MCLCSLRMGLRRSFSQSSWYIGHGSLSDVQEANIHLSPRSLIPKIRLIQRSWVNSKNVFATRHSHANWSSKLCLRIHHSSSFCTLISLGLIISQHQSRRPLILVPHYPSSAFKLKHVPRKKISTTKFSDKRTLRTMPSLCLQLWFSIKQFLKRTFINLQKLLWVWEWIHRSCRNGNILLYYLECFLLLVPNFVGFTFVSVMSHVEAFELSSLVPRKLIRWMLV